MKKKGKTIIIASGSLEITFGPASEEWKDEGYFHAGEVDTPIGEINFENDNIMLIELKDTLLGDIGNLELQRNPYIDNLEILENQNRTIHKLSLSDYAEQYLPGNFIVSKANKAVLQIKFLSYEVSKLLNP